MEIKIFSARSKSFKKLSDYEEEKKARKVTRKCREEIDRFETKIKNIRELIIDTTEYDCGELISDLNF